MLDFSSVISAVKPRERTDQYRILAALYCLGARQQPIEARKVNELLKLHFQKKVPTNVNASLRTYTGPGYVKPAAKGPPLLWLLTEKGIDHLSGMSGLTLGREADADAFETDIGVVCALEDPEFTAVVTALGGPAAWRTVGSPRYAHVYRESTLTTASGRKLRVVGTTSTSMGLTAAAIVTTQLVLQFKPRIVLMIGIAAGTRTGNKQFGDILVADPSVDYNSGKVSQAGGIREFLPDPYPIGLNPRLRSLLHKYSRNHDVLSDIRKAWLGAAPAPSNKVFLGPLGAADQVIDDESRVLEIQRNWRKLIGVEMETYGVYRACHESPDPKPRFVSFKAVCDFAAEKTDSWQEYAAFVAAEFAFRFLANEWEDLWPKA